jgi:hypothetical protein
MQPKKLITLAIFCFSAFGAVAKAPFKNRFKDYDGYSAAKKSRLKRYYFGYGIPVGMNLDITTKYVTDGDAGTGSVGITREMKLTGVSGYGFQEGTFYTLQKTGGHDAVCLELGFSEYFYKYNVGPVSYGSDATFTDESVVAIACMPIGIAYKSGGEVSMNKQDRSTLSFGVGIAPAMSIAKVFAVDLKFGVRGYVAAEVGIFAGIEWKLRATYYTSNSTLINVSGDLLDNVTKYNVTGSLGTMDVKAVAGGDFNVALVILPFSFKWDKVRSF